MHISVNLCKLLFLLIVFFFASDRIAYTNLTFSQSSGKELEFQLVHETGMKIETNSKYPSSKKEAMTSDNRHLLASSNQLLLKKPGWEFLFVNLIFFFFLAGVILVIKNSRIKKLITSIEDMKKWEIESKLMLREKEMVIRQNELLKLDLESKSKDLYESEMNLMRMKKVMNDLKGGIDVILDNNNVINKNQLQKLQNVIDEKLVSDDEWVHFEMLFGAVHDDFLQRLKQSKYKLTNREIRLCTYLRMNMTAKEIAPLMGITHRAVEALRYRIRKKFGLKSSDNLNDVIIKV